MPAKFGQEAIAAIQGALRQFPNGATAAQILTQLPEPPDDRTLEKWINDMVACNTLRRDGVGAEARFFALAADPVRQRRRVIAEPAAQCGKLMTVHEEHMIFCASLWLNLLEPNLPTKVRNGHEKARRGTKRNPSEPTGILPRRARNESLRFL